MYVVPVQRDDDLALDGHGSDGFGEGGGGGGGVNVMMSTMEVAEEVVGRDAE